jgi:hypothetical protein
MDRESVIVTVALLLMGTWIAAVAVPEVSFNFLLNILAGAVLLWLMRERSQ